MPILLKKKKTEMLLWDFYASQAVVLLRDDREIQTATWEGWNSVKRRNQFTVNVCSNTQTASEVCIKKFTFLKQSKFAVNKVH